MGVHRAIAGKAVRTQLLQFCPVDLTMKSAECAVQVLDLKLTMCQCRVYLHRDGLKPAQLSRLFASMSNSRSVAVCVAAANMPSGIAHSLRENPLPFIMLELRRQFGIDLYGKMSAFVDPMQRCWELYESACLRVEKTETRNFRKLLRFPDEHPHVGAREGSIKSFGKIQGQHYDLEKIPLCQPTGLLAPLMQQGMEAQSVLKSLLSPNSHWPEQAWCRLSQFKECTAFDPGCKSSSSMVA